MTNGGRNIKFIEYYPTHLISTLKRLMYWVYTVNQGITMFVIHSERVEKRFFVILHFPPACQRLMAQPLAGRK